MEDKVNQRTLVTVLVALLLGGLLAACRDESSEEEVAAISYLQAVLTNDADYLESNTCKREPDGSGTQNLLALWSIGLALRAAGPDYNEEDLVVDVTADMAERGENETRVFLSGDVEIPADLLPSEQMPLPAGDTVHLDEVWIMVQEDGDWKWCGSEAVE